jgi:hypothetical protein
MTSTPEPRSNELSVLDMYEALQVKNKEFDSISWGGFNLFGDHKSIQEVRRLLHEVDVNQGKVR